MAFKAESGVYLCYKKVIFIIKNQSNILRITANISLINIIPVIIISLFRQHHIMGMHRLCYQ
jgi:hypothetical protein